MPTIKSCGFLIYRETPELSFLLMRHADRWDLPKGHVDPGESKLQAAYRELQEETGIEGDQICLDGRFRYRQDYKVPGQRYGRTGLLDKSLYIYLGKLVGDVEIQSVEHLGHAWFPWAPPHQIQKNTIDPLLAEVSLYWQNIGKTLG